MRSSFAACRRAFLVTCLIASVIVIDQLSKKWAMSSLREGYDDSLIDHFLTFRLRFNRGGTLGVLPGQTGIWIVLQLAVLVLIPTIPFLLFRNGLPMRGWIGIAALMGAGTSNLVDQLRLAAAIDFIHVPYFTFNLADVAGLVGVVMVFLAIPHDARLNNDGRLAPP